VGDATEWRKERVAYGASARRCDLKSDAAGVWEYLQNSLMSSIFQGLEVILACDRGQRRRGGYWWRWSRARPGAVTAPAGSGKQKRITQECLSRSWHRKCGGVWHGGGTCAASSLGVATTRTGGGRVGWVGRGGKNLLALGLTGGVSLRVLGIKKGGHRRRFAGPRRGRCGCIYMSSEQVRYSESEKGKSEL